jgi:hypothetical protein
MFIGTHASLDVYLPPGCLHLYVGPHPFADFPSTKQQFVQNLQSIDGMSVGLLFLLPNIQASHVCHSPTFFILIKGHLDPDYVLQSYLVCYRDD